MNAHHVLLPSLLIVGIGECAAVNVVATRLEATAPPPPGARATPASAPAAERAESMASALTPAPHAAPAGAKNAAATADDRSQLGDQTEANDANGSAAGAALQGTVMLPFAPQSALFDPNARREMFKIARLMKDEPQRKIHIVGHADRNTDADRADSLPARRAKSCHDFIVQLGVENERVSFEAATPTTSPDPAEGGEHRAARAIWRQ